MAEVKELTNRDMANYSTVTERLMEFWLTMSWALRDTKHIFTFPVVWN
jgi:hypothetical protein